MKIQAILFMCNDFARAKFTLENFSKWNPDIPIRIINSGGDSPKPHLQHINNTEFIDAPNLWHKKTHCGKGSFGPEFIKYFFDYGLNSSFTHTLLLETDVLTNRKITIEPKYDIAGPTNPCGHNELILYNYLNINDNLFHTGCGGTIFSYKYFDTIFNKNYSFFLDIFDKFPQNYFMDLILTLASRVNGLTFGHWEEVSNIPIHFINGRMINADMNKTLIHNYKI
jgi:hypothetical protein